MSYGALGSLSLPLTLAAGALGLLLGPWLLRLPRLAITFLLFSLIFGQSLRAALPGQGGGILISDIAVVIVLLVALSQVIFKKRNFKNSKSQSTNHKQSTGFKEKKHKHSNYLCFCDLCFVWNLCFLLCAFSLFILWSLFTLVIHIPELGSYNTAIAFAYWARLTSHLFLLPALLILFQDAIVVVTTRRLLLLATAILVLLGFLQLWLVPDFTILTKLGWDPHQGRLTSTWLDPNFFGAFLAITLSFVLSHLISLISASPRCLDSLILARSGGGLRGSRPFRPSPLLGDQAEKASQSAPKAPQVAPLSFLLVIIIISLLLTQSRSAFIALTLSILVLSPLIIAGTLRRPSPPRIIAAISSLLLALILISGAAVLLHDRLAGLVTLDATARLRLTALQEAWQLVQQHAWLGVGYNAYQFAAVESGLISNFTIHSRAGADNSLITLGATTGLVGLVLFLAPWAFIGQALFRRWLTNNNYYALAALVSLVALLIHSQFVNSLLYSHLLITLIVIVALALNEHSVKSKEQRVKQQLKT